MLAFSIHRKITIKKEILFVKTCSERVPAAAAPLGAGGQDWDPTQGGHCQAWVASYVATIGDV